MTEEDLERLYKAETGNRKGYCFNDYYLWCEARLIEKENELYNIQILFLHKDNSGRK